jgi:hypothetical protein
MLVSGNGPGGSSGVDLEEIWTGMVFLLMAFASATTGFFFVRWAFNAWESPRRLGADTKMLV